MGRLNSIATPRPEGNGRSDRLPAPAQAFSYSSSAATALAGPRLAQTAPVAQLDRAPDYESGGQEFESLRARHFGTKLSTPKAAVFALEAATSVRSNTLFEPMMRSSFASIFASFPK